MCKHLQQLMPQESHKSVRSFGIDFINNIPEAETNKEELSELELRRKLKKYGLQRIKVAVLIYKFYYGCTFAEIAKYLNIPHRQTVYHIYKNALAMLRERGYK